MGSLDSERTDVFARDDCTAGSRTRLAVSLKMTMVYCIPWAG